ncbi:sua1 [Symbiodinium necroappetens]|uniref:Sua1 protein n=1 Tax=Symbiodinium necroappetens TaxID=1628268 RepID=A0A812WPH3_9DINO|nr:sua1 [Symbiodinium necroappetens]
MSHARSFVVLLLPAALLAAVAFVAPRAPAVAKSPRVVIRAGEERKDFLDDSVPEWRSGIAGRKGAIGFLGFLTLVIAYLFTKAQDPEVRQIKICVRSKQFEKDFFNDPAKAEWAKKKGYKALQDPDCKEWPEVWEKIKPF